MQMQNRSVILELIAVTETETLHLTLIWVPDRLRAANHKQADRQSGGHSQYLVGKVWVRLMLYELFQPSVSIRFQHTRLVAPRH